MAPPRVHLERMAMARRYVHLVGSKFTSNRPIDGWRQFHVIGLRRVEGGYDAELQASCDATVRLRLRALDLFDQASWAPGWKQLSELRAATPITSP